MIRLKASGGLEMANEEKAFNKNILIAVDPSENSRRAVSYVGQLLGGLAGFKATILHIKPKPEEDFFAGPEDEERWLRHYSAKIDTLLEEYRRTLIRWGFDPADVTVRSPLRYCPSMAECILTERDETRYDTIVVGRQGLSRKEEFLLGSISSKLVTHAKNCTVWVVE
jgi:nucleotide-binding universal stress UspA family protein